MTRVTLEIFPWLVRKFSGSIEAVLAIDSRPIVFLFPFSVLDWAV